MEQKNFLNRTEAAKQLAALLKQYKGTQAVVLGIPRGGVVPAKIIAQELSLPLGILVVRKIGHPENPEYAIGAVSESGIFVAHEEDLHNVDAQWLKQEIQTQLLEAKRRRETYWGKRASINLKGKTVIIVDDGLATGLTMSAAIKEVKHYQPATIVVAVPISPMDTAEKLKKEVDAFVAVTISEFFTGSVGSYYQEFPQVEDEEVKKMLS